MKAKDWQKAAQLVHERQSQVAMTDTSELSSFSLSELSWTKADHPPLYTDHMFPYLQVCQFVCHQIINKPQKLHRMKLPFDR